MWKQKRTEGMSLGLRTRCILQNKQAMDTWSNAWPTLSSSERFGRRLGGEFASLAPRPEYYFLVHLGVSKVDTRRFTGDSGSLSNGPSSVFMESEIGS